MNDTIANATGHRRARIPKQNAYIIDPLIDIIAAEKVAYGKEIETSGNTIKEESKHKNSEITRCPCNRQSNRGLMICCEKCQVWQHTDCVGLPDKLPSVYYCEQCKPEGHPYFDKLMAMEEFANEQSRKSSRVSSRSISNATKKESTSQKPRNTMNSMDWTPQQIEFLFGESSASEAAKRRLSISKSHDSNGIQTPDGTEDLQQNNSDRENDSLDGEGLMESSKATRRAIRSLKKSSQPKQDQLAIRPKGLSENRGKRKQETVFSLEPVASSNEENSDNNLDIMAEISEMNSKPKRLKKDASEKKSRQQAIKKVNRSTTIIQENYLETPDDTECTPVMSEIHAEEDVSIIAEELIVQTDQPVVLPEILPTDFKIYGCPPTPPCRPHHIGKKTSITEMIKRVSNIEGYIAKFESEVNSSLDGENSKISSNRDIIERLKLRLQSFLVEFDQSSD